MTDFSFLSDTDDSAVEELIAQTKELCILEQVAAINCSGFVDSGLPSELESRFCKLKSFPDTKSKNKTSPSHLRSRSNLDQSSFSSKTDLDKSVVIGKEHDSHSDENCEVLPNTKQDPTKKSDSKSTFRSGHRSPPLDSSDYAAEKGGFWPLKETSFRERGSKAKLKLGSASEKNIDHENRCPNPKFQTRSYTSPSGSSNSLRDSPSPPKKFGCFWCSPKKYSSRKGKDIRVTLNELGWSRDDELLSDLRTFSTKEQQKILKKAAKEEDKICREAEKIVNWAKQASARMSISSIEDELSDG